MLENAIASWDNKSAVDIKAIYQAYREQNNFQQALISALTSKISQQGATWLLKHHLERKAVLNSQEIKAVFQSLELLDHWESRLHILQSLEKLKIPLEFKQTFNNFVRSCLKSDKKILRAWGYNGFHLLAEQYPEFADERDRLFAKAAQGEAPSVKARIRNIVKTKT